MTNPDLVPAELRELRSRPLFVMNVAVGAIHVTGGPVGAERRVSDLTGGTFSGDRLSGKILPGGTDWQTIREDGTALLDARVTLATDDGALIAMSYAGIRHGPADILARIGRGEDVDPGSYYFRIVPGFTTSAPRYEWLNRIASIGIGHRRANGPVYSVFEIL
ncbi:DUF3237 domain-containing protein [Sphingomonas sp. LaA6.9]|uniref:DUF3237 domain-containing protein n=1 Tax=Sphingomonas sp. LaA6.9 TaxID=2919914 RepID=UPI001F4F7C6C|nr:DUF3237 domain-containing protein [Sphingomonas sp. LaA6.9]MCJ8159088.1 DUF3237 domain-containing protein [Sphingomonas sp. LaA6.9]